METDFKRWRLSFCFASGRNEKLETSRTVAQKKEKKKKKVMSVVTFGELWL